METGEWRHGRTDDDRWPGGASSAGPGPPREPDPPPAASTSAAPDLWVDDPSTAWGSSASWEPPADGEASRTGERYWDDPVTTGRGQPRHAAPTGPTNLAAAAGADQAQAGYPPEVTGAYPTAALSTGPVPQASRYPPEVAATLRPVSASPADAAGNDRRPGRDDWPTRSAPSRRRPVTEEEQYGRRRGERYSEDPAYGPVLAYTVGWYGVPALLHLIWLLTIDGDRQLFAWRTLIASLPWLLGALVFSLAIAGVLRWAIVEWRAMTISFAAAVVGAGVTTIIYSLTI